YKIDHHLQPLLQIEHTTISNGMAWSADRTKFYYIDSPLYEVSVFDFDPKNNTIKNRKTLFKIPKSFGSPDGMTIDEEGMLWIAHWGGSCVRRWNPADGKVLQRIPVDAPHVTSCCFGGKDFNILYITTARSGLGEDELRDFPLSGGLFCVKTEVAGRAVSLFKNNV
ncbi:MAG: SMP-30/gluconolactonase/LRE family protein, partial [Eudoraea sp.]|nr:SMP-30/gluconolactonase/LRE family protein [Eudoraea sp.]